MSRKNRRKEKELKHTEQKENDPKPTGFIWHLEKGYKGKILEKILGSGEGPFAKIHQKWLDDKRKSEARGRFKRSKKNGELN